jgi:hypothetical protein
MSFLSLLDQEIEAQERVLEAHPAYVKLKALRAARALYAGSDQHPPVVARQPDAVERRRPAPSAGKSLDAVSAVIEILRETGAPLRTMQLMPLIEQRGIHFAGNAPQNILSSLLSRSPDVVSKGGHVGWALTEWDSAGGDKPGGSAPPADVQPEAQGREAGPGGGT